MGANVTCPFLVVAGEDDELSPIEYTYELLNEVKAPKELLLYQGERHGLNSNTSSSLGPDAQTYIADWLADRLQGKPALSQHLFVDMQGQVHVRAWNTQDGGGQFKS